MLRNAAPCPPGIDKLSPEQYRSIHFDREAAIWRREGLPFRLELLRAYFNQRRRR